MPGMQKGDIMGHEVSRGDTCMTDVSYAVWQRLCRAVLAKKRLCMPDSALNHKHYTAQCLLPPVNPGAHLNMVSLTVLHLYTSCWAQFMGIVHEVGPNVKSVKKGDRVVACFDIGYAAGFCSASHLPRLQAWAGRQSK